MKSFPKDYGRGIFHAIYFVSYRLLYFFITTYRLSELVIENYFLLKEKIQNIINILAMMAVRQ